LGCATASSVYNELVDTLCQTKSKTPKSHGLAVYQLNHAGREEPRFYTLRDNTALCRISGAFSHFLGPTQHKREMNRCPFPRQSREKEGRLGPFFLLSGKGSRLSNELQPRDTRCSRTLPTASPHAPRRRPGVSRAGPGRSSPDVSPARSGEARELSPSKS